MYLGLDLRGGVHFLLQVDMKGALTKRLDSVSADLRSLMRDKTIRHGGINREGERIVIRFRDEETRVKARTTLDDSQPDLQLADQGEGSELRLVATLKPTALKRIQEFAIKQNMGTLHNRINELGVAEPVIAATRRSTVSWCSCRACRIRGQGKRHPRPHRDPRDPPGGRHARRSLESALQAGNRSLSGTELYVRARRSTRCWSRSRSSSPASASPTPSPGFDGQNHEPAVHLTLDAAGSPASSRTSPARTSTSGWPSC